MTSKMKPIKKEQAAVEQLCDAIELFNKKRFLSAITLAAAAEEITAQLLKQHSKKTNIPLITDEELDTFLFDETKDQLGIENYHGYKNKIRNELKHHGDETNKDNINGNFRRAALTHIKGAINNYFLVNRSLPDNEIIKAFCDKIGLNNSVTIPPKPENEITLK